MDYNIEGKYYNMSMCLQNKFEILYRLKIHNNYEFIIQIFWLFVLFTIHLPQRLWQKKNA